MVEKKQKSGRYPPTKERRKEMAEDQKKTDNPFESCCQGMPFADMMRKMMEKKTTGAPFDCAEMMSRMKAMCCGSPMKEEKTAQDQKGKEKI